MAFRRPARWPTFTALAIALIGVAVGLVGWFHPAPHNGQTSAAPKPAYTDQQVADAKAHMCITFGKVDRGLDLVDAQAGSSDPTKQLAVAALTRQAFDFSSRHLLMTLAEEPATPPELAAAVRQEANSLQELLIGFLDGLPNSDSEQQPVVKANNEATATIRRLCK